MKEIKGERTKEIIRQKAAEFLEREGNGASLLTVTSVALSDKGRRATVFFTVYPAALEQSALEFAKRQRSAFREYLGARAKMLFLPIVDFALDLGEKNRQKIDELSRET